MPIVISIYEDGPPKRQIIELAFSEIGAAGYEFGRTPEEVTDALTRLNAMMAEWKTMRGIDIGYLTPTYGVGNADDLSGIPNDCLNVVSSFLALRICPMMGGALGAEAKGNMARSLALLEAHYAAIPAMPLGGTIPRGAGAEHGRGVVFSPFIRETYDGVNPAPEEP